MRSVPGPICGEPLLALVGQCMAIRLKRLDGEDSNERYIGVYLSKMKKKSKFGN